MTPVEMIADRMRADIDEFITVDTIAVIRIEALVEATYLTDAERLEQIRNVLAARQIIRKDGAR